jgi:hypothetical protein
MQDEQWPLGGRISIVGLVQQDGKIDYTACLLLGWPDKRTYSNKNCPEYNMVNAVRECYDAWLEDNKEDKQCLVLAGTE